MIRFGLILAMLTTLSGGQYIPAGPHFPIASGFCGTYLHYRVITIAAQSTLSGNLSNYPVAVSGTYTYLATAVNGGLVQNASGFDVGFFTDNTCATKLPWETETYGNTGVVNYWVQVPTISKTASVTFIMAYDNPAISTDQSNRTGVWDTNFLGVYHLPNGTTLTTADSTSNANNGTPTSASAATGQIDGATSFVGTGNINMGTNLTPLGSGRTFQAWIFPTSFANAYNCVMCESEAGFSAPFALMVKSNGKLAMYVGAQGGTVNYDGTGSHTLSLNTWYLVHLTYDTTSGLIGYVNGSQDGTAAPNSTIAANGNNADIGDHPSIAGRNWNGKIDEARASNIGRSADWSLTDYNSQSSPSTFYSIGSQF